MKIPTKKILCEQVIKAHIDRMHELCDNDNVSDAECIYSEIREWIIQKENLEVLTLENISQYFND